MAEKPIVSPPMLAETKFHPPLLREDVIGRHHLLSDLNDRLASSPLTLLSAPAGYGKTTLLAGLAAAYPALPQAWLSLDEEDNDPARFLTALIVALQHLDPTCGAAAQSLLTSPVQRGVAVRQVTSVLINDVLETLADPFVLVLDDLHRITEPSIFVALDYLLEHRPAQLHLVVATRVDPPLALARLRARGEMVELRLAELRFSEEEAVTFLNNRLRLNLSAENLTLLHACTEGWPVGLRLLASSLERLRVAADRTLFIEHLARTDRNIFDFLAEEVFNRQKGEVQAFLLQTAILPELTSRLCQAVTQRADAGDMLDELYRRNLFLVQVSPASKLRVVRERQPRRHPSRLEPRPAPSERRYRYHDLFAEFLRNKLEQTWPERVPQLHGRAAEAEADLSRAVAHFLAAGKWQEAAQLIEAIGTAMFNRGYLETLVRWINALPTPVRESRPRLLHYLSYCAFAKGAWGEVEPLLKRALHGFAAAGDEAAQGEVLADLATCAAGRGDLEESAALCVRALTYPVPAHTRVQALLGRALAAVGQDDVVQTERDFNEAMTIVEQSGELDPLHLVTFPFFHPDFAFLPGGLERLERVCRQARVLVGDEISPARLMVEEMTTILYLFRGRVAQAVANGERALALRQRLGGHPYLALNAALYLMIAHTVRGDYAAAEPLFDRLFLGIDQTGQPPPDLPIYLYYAGRVRWLQGHLAEARAICAQIESFSRRSSIGEALEIRICSVWMRSLLAMAGGRYEEAERALRRPDILEQKDRGSKVHGNTRLMLARLCWQQGREQEALVELAPVLAYHEQLGIPFTILLEGQSVVPLLRGAVTGGIHASYATYLLGLLGADGDPRPVNVPQTGETLTPRELEVLRDVVDGYSNRVIADDLTISEWTVKSHLTKIYRKLDVSSRTQAIVRARELGIG